jgi:HTH-type transcriptional regulator, cell division transcriptional repressor
MNRSDVVEAVGDRIVHAREAAGLSTAQLARRAGVRTHTLAAWETGRAEPRANKLVMLAGILNVSPTWLLMGQGQAPTDTPSEIAMVMGELSQLRAMQERTAQIIERLGNHVATLEARGRVDG